ncbi:MAG: hypothetical protein IBX41_04165 [Methanophagales archaeon]|nr:hypothetical protein [Methanophagales archaeon]
MGIVEEMHNLCEDIVASRFERGEAVEGIKSETRDLLMNFNVERKKMSDELRSDLKEAAETIKADTRGKLREFSDARAEMSKELAKGLEEYTTEISDSVRNMREEFAEEQAKMGRELRRELGVYNSGIKKDVAGLLNDFTEERVKMGSEQREELGEYNVGIKKDVRNLLTDFSVARSETVKELKEMHDEWQRMVEPRVEVKKKVAEEKAEEGEVSEPELRELKEKVLEVINSAPGGISLTGIGLKLDMEWRKLIHPAKELLDDGKIRKENLNYYPLKEEEKEEEKW